MKSSLAWDWKLSKYETRGTLPGAPPFYRHRLTFFDYIMPTFTLIGKVEGYFHGALHSIGTPTLRNINKDLTEFLAPDCIACVQSFVISD